MGLPDVVTLTERVSDGDPDGLSVRVPVLAAEAVTLTERVSEGEPEGLSVCACSSSRRRSTGR